LLGRPSGEWNQWVETSIAWTLKQNAPGGLILDKEEKRMKLNENIIIKSKSMNRYKIF
jgi:hypothetical protein